jgi:glucose-6-phosphate 1-epimerase
LRLWQVPKLEWLNTHFRRQGAVAFARSPMGGIVAELTSPAGSATVALEGAQVLDWRQGAERGLLWLSPAARLGTGRPVRGGIPVCWPWFGPHPSDPAAPAHGFVRTRQWEVVRTEAEPDATRLLLATLVEAGDRPDWPHAAGLRLEIELGAGLALTLETQNLGKSAIELTEALHTYFRIGDIAAVRIDGLEGCAYIDKLDGGKLKSQSGPVTIDREVDRIYVGATDRLALVDPGLGRRISIDSVGSRSAVVWNPWLEKSARLGDMGPEGYRRMVCIETANAGDDRVILASGDTHRLEARLSVLQI